MTANEKRAVMHALVETLAKIPEKERGGAVPLLVAELARMRMLPQGNAVLRMLEHAWIEKFGPRTVTLTSAHRVPVDVKERLQETYPTSEVKTVIDPRLLGGAVLSAGDMVRDGSLTGALTRMKQRLLSLS